MTSLLEFYKMLEMNDWYYEMSDSPRVYKTGVKQNSELKTIASQSKEHQELFDEYREYIWNGTHKPERPKE